MSDHKAVSFEFRDIMCNLHCSFSTTSVLTFGKLSVAFLKGVTLAVAVLTQGIGEKEVAVSYLP